MLRIFKEVANILSSIVRSQHLSVFVHIGRMPDDADAKNILTASPVDNGRHRWDFLVHCG